MTIFICHNKPPDRKWVWTAVTVNWEWVVNLVLGRDGPENLSILKRKLVKVRSLGWVVEFFGQIKARPTEMSWDPRHAKMRRACVGVSIVWLACAFMICFSLLVSPRNEDRKKQIRSYRLHLYYYCCYWHHYDYRLIGLVGRVFANDPGDLGSIPGRVIPKTLKMVLDTSLLNTKQYKVRIKGKVEKSRERRSALPLHFSVVAIEKGAFGSPSTKVSNFTLLMAI